MQPSASATCRCGDRQSCLNTLTANSMFGRNWPKNRMPRITLVDKSDRFTYKPLLYDVLTKTASEDEVAPFFSHLLAPYPITFVQAQVSSVDPSAAKDKDREMPEGSGKVILEGGESIGYDWLVVALGAQTDSRGVPGVRELALALNSYDDAVKVFTIICNRSGQPFIV